MSGHSERPESRGISVARGAERRGGRTLRSLALRAVVALAIIAALALLLHDRWAALDLGEVRALVRLIPPERWVLAAALAAISFWAAGRYDRVAHAMLGTGETPARAGRSGIIAIAIGQTVGFGVVTGALVRWRLCPRLTLWRATEVSVTVAASFLAGLAVTAALLIGPLGLTPFPGARSLAAGVLALAILLPALALFRPGPLARIALPSSRAMLAFLGLTLLDLAGAGLALAVLIPVPLELPLGQVLAAAVLALGAGIVSGTPGGVGPFEVTLLALLPGSPAEPVLAGILAFRLVYYLIPALIAGAAAIWIELGPMLPGLPGTEGAHPPSGVLNLDRHLDRAPRAEAALLRHTGLALQAEGRPVATLSRAGSHLVMIGEAHRPTDDLIGRLTAAAKSRMLSPLIYKAGARTASLARARGWAVVRIAEEAWIAPARFDEGRPACRQLRRKLRSAAKAGIRVTPAQGALPFEAMSGINAAWCQEHGQERGFSMSRFPGPSLKHGRTFLAWRGEELVAFVTFHSCSREWTLDLMRHGPDLPAGTMQALIRAAIAAAAAEGVPRLSLAAVPMLSQHLPPMLARRFETLAGAEGLRRFKSAFDPAWEPLYAAAPARPDLTAGLIAVAREISGRTRPPLLRRSREEVKRAS